MPIQNSAKIPKYRHHRQSGQAMVTLNGRDICLGAYGTAQSRAKYDQTIAEWIAAGRQIASDPATFTIRAMMTEYKRHVDRYYRRPDGTATREPEGIGHALRPLRKLYADLPAAEFSPLKLKAVREAMIDPTKIEPGAKGKGWCRKLINKSVIRIRAMFKWGVENEFIPPSVYHGLLAVAPLKAGRSEARESEPVLPVDDAIVDATLPHLNSVVAAMVKLQRLTGARPGEIFKMKTGEINTAGQVWTYAPTTHKTQHHGRTRAIAIGPRAQEILRPFLKPLNPAAFIFSPIDAMAEVRERRNAARKTPNSCGNGVGKVRVKTPRKIPGNCYTKDSYARSISRACKLAFPAPKNLATDEVKKWHHNHHWHPNRLRHSAATSIRKRFGLEGAQVVLGHAHANVTQIYAERDFAAAAIVAAEVG